MIQLEQAHNNLLLDLGTCADAAKIFIKLIKIEPLVGEVIVQDWGRLSRLKRGSP